MFCNVNNEKRQSGGTGQSSILLPKKWHFIRIDGNLSRAFCPDFSIGRREMFPDDKERRGRITCQLYSLMPTMLIAVTGRAKPLRRSSVKGSLSTRCSTLLSVF